MNESDYILATNIAKIRIAIRAIKDMLFMDNTQESNQRDLLVRLNLLENDLSNELNTKLNGE